MRRVYDAKGAGIVFAPGAAAQRILCSYAGDGLSREKTCSPLGVSASCVPGCYTKVGSSSWCSAEMHSVGADRDASACAWRPTQLNAMILSMTAAARSWNEVVLDASVLSSPPDAIEAVFYPLNSPRGERRARALWRRLQHNRTLRASLPLLLTLDVTDGYVVSPPAGSGLASGPFRLAPSYSAATNRPSRYSSRARGSRYSNTAVRNGRRVAKAWEHHSRRSSGRNSNISEGVVMCVYLHSAASLVGRAAVAEAIAGARQLRSVSNPQYPIEASARASRTIIHLITMLPTALPHMSSSSSPV